MTASSLRLRLLIAWAVFIAVTLQIAGVGLRLLYEHSITERTRTELAADLRQLRRGMETNGEGELFIAREPTDPQFDIGFGGRYWQISEGDRVLIKSRSLKEAALSLPKDLKIPSEGLTFRTIGPLDQQLYAFALHHVPEGPENATRVLSIVTAVDAAEIKQDTDKFSSDLYFDLALLAALLLAGAFVHVTIGLRPLEALRSRVADVRAGRTEKIEGTYPDEVMPLVDETNALLDGQRRQLRAARERAADLAHGLKTPLAVMAAKSRHLRRLGQAEIADDVDRQIEVMRRHVERELARARARGGSVVGLSTDIADLARRLVDALRSLPRAEPLSWSASLPDELFVPVDGDDFNNLAGNLFENAQKWAKSRVEVRLSTVAGMLKLSVDDDGPGIGDDHIDRVLMRGERADTAVPGTGLGLAIVSDLVEMYQGALTLDRSALGGLKVTVTLPLPQADG